MRKAEGDLCRPSGARWSLATLSHVRRWSSQRLQTAVFGASRGFICGIEATARSRAAGAKQLGDAALEDTPNCDH